MFREGNPMARFSRLESQLYHLQADNLGKLYNIFQISISHIKIKMIIIIIIITLCIPVRMK